MKKNNRFFFLFIIFFNFSYNASSQNLNKTLEWIKVAIETNTYSFATLSSDTTELIITTESSGQNILGIRQSIPLKKIQSARFREENDTLRLELKCTSEQCVKLEMKGEKPLEFEWTFVNNAVFASILFTTNVNIDMRNRIESAFNHLILLEGGTTLDNTF